MDPNANIAEQRELANALLSPVISESGFLDTSARIEQAERLAELVIELDKWQLKGGFSPYGNK